MKILMVDDEPELLKQAKIFLKKENNEFEIDTDLSAEEGLEQLEEEYDAIVSDYQMPDIDGLEFLKIIRREKEKNIPFIMFTGKGREEVAMKALNLGANRYLQKGGDPRSQYGVLAQAIVREVEHRRTEKRLELTKHSVDKAKLGVFWIEPSGKFVYVNDTVIERLGYTEDELMDMHVWDIDNYYQKERRDEFWNKLKEDGSLRIESIHQKKSGYDIPVEVNSTYIEHKGRELEFAFVEDISDKKEKKRELKESKNRLSQIVDGSSVPMFVIDEDHRITHWNKACENISGLKKEDVVGTKDPWRAFYEEERPVMADLVLDDVSEEKIEKWYGDKFSENPNLKGAYEAEAFFPDMAGEGRWLYFTAAPLKNSDGERIGAIETLQDVTSRRGIKNELRESEEKYKKLFYETPLGTFRFDNEGVITDCNDIFVDIIGSSKEALIGLNMIHDLDDEDLIKEVKLSLTEGEGYYKGEYGSVTADKTTPVRVLFKGLRDKDGDIYAGIGIVEDITARVEAEKELKRSESLLKRSQSLAKIGGWEYDVKEDWFTWTDEIYRIYGVNKEEYDPNDLNKSISFYSPEDRDKIDKAFKNAVENGEAYDLELRLNPADGSEIWVRTIGEPVVEDGEVVKVFGNIMDITDKKENEKKVEEQHSFHQAIMENSNVWVNVTGPKGKVIKHWNKAAEDISGYSAEEVVGHDKVWEWLYPDDSYREDLLKKVPRFVRGELDLKNKNTRIKCKDGEEKVISWNSHIMKDKDGNIIGNVAMGIDITDQVEAKDRFKENKDKIVRLHEISSRLQAYKSEEEVYSFVIEAAEDILDFDICAILVPEEDKMVNALTSSKFPDKHHTAIKPLPIDDSVAGKTYLENRTFSLRDIDQEKIDIDTDNNFRSGISIPLGDHGVFQAVSYEVDDFDEEDVRMTELLADHVVEALKRIEMEKREDFLHSLLRHDVGNKSQIVKGYLQLMEEYDVPEDVGDCIEKAEKAIDGSIDIIQKVRTLRQVEKKDGIDEVNMRLLMDKMISRYHSRLEEKDIELDFDGCSCVVKGGPIIEELFHNLLENSIKHSGCDRIKISSKVVDDKCLVCIEDDGKGIPDDVKEKVFDKGYRKGMDSGTGLGLYLVKVIAESYGGKVEVKDSSLGGARFDVWLEQVRF